jgi:hypothetical protein
MASITPPHKPNPKNILSSLGIKAFLCLLITDSYLCNDCTFSATDYSAGQSATYGINLNLDASASSSMTFVRFSFPYYAGSKTF